MVRTLNTCGTVRKRYIKIDLTCRNNYEASITINRGQILSQCKLSTINNDIYKAENYKRKDGAIGLREVWAYLMYGSKKAGPLLVGNPGHAGFIGDTEIDNSGNPGAETTYRVKLEMVYQTPDKDADAKLDLKEWLANRPPMSVVFSVC